MHHCTASFGSFDFPQATQSASQVVAIILKLRSLVESVLTQSARASCFASAFACSSQPVHLDFCIFVMVTPSEARSASNLTLSPTFKFLSMSG
jgi:hypothetical protein